MTEEFRFETAIFQANLADEIHGSVLPLKIGGNIPIFPGSDIKKAWDFAYNEANAWAIGKGLIIAGYSIAIEKKDETSDEELIKEMSVFESFKTKAECEKHLPNSPFKYHIKIKEIINAKKD